MMRTNDIIKEIKMLPVEKRMLIIEKAIRSIRKQTDQKQMQFAAEELQSEYKNNNELTEFTKLDIEDFYEAR
jgi:hypothetical protein